MHVQQSDQRVPKPSIDEYVPVTARYYLNLCMLEKFDYVSTRSPCFLRSCAQIFGHFDFCDQAYLQAQARTQVFNKQIKGCWYSTENH